MANIKANKKSIRPAAFRRANQAADPLQRAHSPSMRTISGAAGMRDSLTGRLMVERGNLPPCAGRKDL